MGDESTLFGQLSQLNPSGQTRNSKEVPVDKDSRRRSKGKKKREQRKLAIEESDLEEPEEGQNEKPASGKVVDILV
jgi:hypothetical protein